MPKSSVKISKVKTKHFFLAEAKNINPLWADDLWRGVTALNFGKRQPEFEALSGCAMRARSALAYTDDLNGKRLVMVCPHDITNGSVDDEPITLDYDVFIAVDKVLGKRQDETL